MNIAEFVHKSLDEVIPTIEKYGFVKLKIDHLTENTNISRSLLWRYFGGLNGLLQLVLRQEIEKCYTHIWENTTPTDDHEELLKQLQFYRKEFTDESKLLQRYREDSNNMSKRINQLKIEVAEIEEYERLRFFSVFISKSKVIE
ncbi:TetR/AcrR family transcriptional regulator [Sphingobacterium sp. LRF_L2]|uniref:TetR/AcrR family transcriptional regulator n=1 Tax=Sphingobacterium sp. LRF_L2 TaxID=3369421 RepID=UPI003F619C7D